mgnify:CR=1 FL=1
MIPMFPSSPLRGAAIHKSAVTDSSGNAPNDTIGGLDNAEVVTLVVDADDRLRARVRDGRVTARLTSAAQQVLLERADERAGVYGVVAAGRFWPLTAAPPSPPA